MSDEFRPGWLLEALKSPAQRKAMFARIKMHQGSYSRYVNTYDSKLDGHGVTEDPDKADKFPEDKARRLAERWTKRGTKPPKNPDKYWRPISYTVEPHS